MLQRSNTERATSPAWIDRQTREALPRQACGTAASRTTNNWYLNHFVGITPPPWLTPQLCRGSGLPLHWFGKAELSPMVMGASEQLTVHEASTKSSP